MTWILDPTGTYIWILANCCISAAYCTVLGHALPKMLDMHDAWACRTKRFIYCCGVGHLTMVIFVTMLMHDVWAWRVVVFWDIITAYVSVEFAIQVHLRERAKRLA